ncbi:MAG: Ig-like domain-containing protein [Nitrosotalea sp.]
MPSKLSGKRNYLLLPVLAAVVLILSQVSSHDVYAMPVWSASGPGTTTTTIPDQGVNGTAQFTYHINLGGGGVPTQTWTFETTATQSGPIKLNYNWHGFHAFFEVTTFLNKFDSSGVTNLISQGPVDCCTPPSGGFNYTGSVTFNAVAGQKYGFTLGGSNFDSNSQLLGTFTVKVPPTTTTTTISSSQNPSIFGNPVTFTATVSPSTATGTVTFSIDGTPQAPVTVSSGQATFSSSSLSVGSHTITAAYSGDANDLSSTSSALTQTVTQITTTTTLTSSLNPSTFGQSVTITAAVSPNTATGTVTFSIDGTPQAPVTVSSGQATFSSSSLSVGSHTITAAYSGDTNDAGSTSSTLTQVVNPISFSSFTAKVHIEDNYTHFELKSKFTLGTGSTGINPVTDNISLQVGTFSTTIPSGSFKHDDKQYKFEGVINGVHIETSIKSLGSNTFELKAEAEHANMTGTANPVPVQITIGNNSGTTTVNAKIDVDHDHHNTEHHHSNE